MAVTVDELARRTGAVIEEVARACRTTVVTDNGHPVAAIVSIDGAAARPAELRDLDERLRRQGGLAELRVEDRSLADELIADRRAEAAREGND
jgi:prevent-host-death family protein